MLHAVALIVALVAPFGFLSPVFASAAEAGDVVKCPDFSAVYYIAGDGSRWVFPNEQVFFSWYSDFDLVETISCQDLAAYPLGQNAPYRAGTRLIKLQSAPTVYVMSPGAILHALPSESRAQELFGADWASRVDDLSDAFFPRYSVASEVSDFGYPDGTILKNSDTGTFYYILDDIRRQIPDSGPDPILTTFALTRSAPFDGTTLGEPLTTDDWTLLEALDQVGVPDTDEVVPTSDPLIPVLVVETDIIVNSEPYIITWNDVDPTNIDVTYELQEDSTDTFTSPDLVLSGKETSFRGEKAQQDNPKFYYRIRTKTGETYSRWSDIVRIDVLNHYVLSGVPDTSIPISNKIGITDSTSTSVPIAAANILFYIDQIVHDPASLGVTAQKTVKDLGDYLAWFMDVNDDGSEDRINDGTLGVLHADIRPALLEFIDWRGEEEPWQGFEAPEELVHKSAYNNWTVTELRSGSVSEASALSQIANALKAGHPVLGVYSYWNPESTGERLNDIRFYETGDPVETSAEATIGHTVGVPSEAWSIGVSNSDVGHGVTVVGYIPDYDLTPDDNEDDREDYLIVYDGWTSTFTYMALPFDEWARFYIVTPAASSAPTSSPSLTLPSSVFSGDLVTISWDRIDKATHYELQWDADETFVSPEHTSTTAFDGVTNYTDTHIRNTKSYLFYRVRGVNEFGTGDWSETEVLTIYP